MCVIQAKELAQYEEDKTPTKFKAAIPNLL